MFGSKDETQFFRGIRALVQHARLPIGGSLVGRIRGYTVNRYSHRMSAQHKQLDPEQGEKKNHGRREKPGSRRETLIWAIREDDTGK